MEHIEEELHENEQLAKDHIYGIGANETNRLQVFAANCWMYDDVTYWKWLPTAYQCSDYIYEQMSREDLIDLFDVPRLNTECIMTADEADYLASLPNTITIHRAMCVEEYESGQYGLSWSLSPEVVQFYADEYIRQRHTGKKVIKTVTIDKKDAIAYWAGRQEEEIIYICR
jgi:hypothetical protein